MERKDYMKPAFEVCKLRQRECLLQASEPQPQQLRRGATKMEYDSEEW